MYVLPVSSDVADIDGLLQLYGAVETLRRVRYHHVSHGRGCVVTIFCSTRWQLLTGLREAFSALRLYAVGGRDKRGSLLVLCLGLVYPCTSIVSGLVCVFGVGEDTDAMIFCPQFVDTRATFLALRAPSGGCLQHSSIDPTTSLLL